jgi:hypothetical protein
VIGNNLGSDAVLHLPTEARACCAVEHDCLGCPIKDSEHNVSFEDALRSRGDILVKGEGVECPVTDFGKLMSCGTSGCGHVDGKSLRRKRRKEFSVGTVERD